MSQLFQLHHGNKDKLAAKYFGQKKTGSTWSGTEAKFSPLHPAWWASANWSAHAARGINKAKHRHRQVLRRLSDLFPSKVSAFLRPWNEISSTRSAHLSQVRDADYKPWLQHQQHMWTEYCITARLMFCQPEVMRDHVHQKFVNVHIQNQIVRTERFCSKGQLFAQSALQQSRTVSADRSVRIKANMSDVRSLKYCSKALKQTDPQNHNGLLSIQTNFPQAVLGSGPHATWHQTPALSWCVTWHHAGSEDVGGCCRW